jgi:hypothetical protein
MIAAAPLRKSRSLPIVALAAISLAAGACGVTYFEIPIETPIQPKLDISAFQRVLIAGFVAGGTDDVDANQETVRLLRSQLRSKSSLRVIDADVMELREVAQDQNKAATVEPAGDGQDQQPVTDLDRAAQPLPLPDDIKNEKDLEAYERLFANTAYWRRIGEEFQNPLIVTGTILFVPQSKAGWVSRDVEQFDSFGRRRVVPMRNYVDRKGFLLVPKFIFIDGRSGATLYREQYKEEVLQSAQVTTPALSSYFELMDRIVPNFLSALSSQKIRGTRVLLK